MQYAKDHGIEVRRLYEAGNRLRRAQAKSGVREVARRSTSVTAQGQAVGSAFIKVKLQAKACKPVVVDSDPAVIPVQALLANGVMVSWTHQAGAGEVASELMRALAGLPCSA